ncbi:MAG: cobalamin-dependent protein [Deltaproteobacteria bacterium]|nr:cobalamin-dependent protein [Deltaproteobacteria bacterium]
MNDLNTLKRVLLLYTDRYYLVRQVYPFGLDILAHHLRRCGYEVHVEYPFLPDADLEINLREILERTDPDLIGLGFRNLDTCMACETSGDLQGEGYRTFHFLSWFKKIVDIIREVRPDVPLVAGGGAFTMSPLTMLKNLDLGYGIIGEGEEPFQKFLESYPDTEKLSRVPNLVFLSGGEYRYNPRQKYVFPTERRAEREPKFHYAYHTSGLPVQIKRGCKQHCSYCVEPMLEGPRFVFRKTQEIIDELQDICAKYDDVERIFFVDTEFNIPNLSYPSNLVKSIISSGLSDHFRFASQFLPRPFDFAFARSLSDAGFSIILTCDSFSDQVLAQNGCSYRREHILQVLQMAEDFGIDCTVSLVFGLPGETRETLDETLGYMMRYPAGPLRRYEYTIGGRIYPGTPLSRFAVTRAKAEDLYGEQSEGFIAPYYYCSPDAPFRLKSYIDKAIPFAQVFENRFDSADHTRLAIAYLADQDKWSEASALFTRSELWVKGAVYDYFFKKLLKAGEKREAIFISERFLAGIQESREREEYRDQIGIIQYYLGFLKG